MAVWLLAFLALYWAFCLFWGLATARLARGAKSYFLADRDLPAWIVVAAATAFAFNGWMFLGYPDLIFRDGLPFAETCLGTIAIALGSALFLKRQWMLGKRFGYVTPGEMAAHYFGGEAVRLAMVVIALTFAVPFVALQIGVAGAIVASLSDGLVDRDMAMWVLTTVAFAYVAFGGMRAAAYVGTLQAVLIVAGVVIVGVYAYSLAGGFEPFMRALGGLSRAAAPAEGAPVLATARLFEIPGVIQFTSGLGKEVPAGGLWTGTMIFSYSLALMGLTLNPVFSLIAFSSRSPKGFATQATWGSAGVMGGILILFTVAQGLGADLLGGSEAITAAGLAAATTLGGQSAGAGSGVVGAYLAALGITAPWFAAILAVAAVAAVQALAALSASATSTIVVRDIFRRYLDPDLGIEGQRTYARIGVGLILLAALLLASFAPSAAIALGALALGFGLQLLPVLTAICWVPWITRPAATVGLVAGMIFVLFTEDFGITTAGFFGLELPWGRWPWTIHSALWGLAANVAVAFVISLISQRSEEKAHRRAFHDFLNSHSVAPVRLHYLRHVSWAAALAWLFFAIGPGAVIGNSLFGDPKGGIEGWALGVPPLWAWQLAWWVLGVLLVWLLSYRMGMASMPSKFIALATKAERTLPPPPASGSSVALAAFWVLILAIAVATLLNWGFGR